MNPVNPSRPPIKPRTTSLIRDLQMLANLNLSQDRSVDAVLDSAARQKVLELGASFNSPVHEALLVLSREVWGLAQYVLNQGQVQQQPQERQPSEQSPKQPPE
jgi:hypothetical protein